MLLTLHFALSYSFALPFHSPLLSLQFHFVALRLASALTQIPAEDFPTTSHPLPLPLPSSSLVGICMANRPEWLLADVALLLSQHIVVGIVPDWPIVRSPIPYLTDYDTDSTT